MKLAHLIAFGILSSLSPRAYAHKSETHEAIGATLARTNAPAAAREDDEWGEQSKPSGKQEPAPVQAPLPAAEALPVAAPASAPQESKSNPPSAAGEEDSTPVGEKAAPVKKAPAPAHKAEAAPTVKDSKPAVAPETEAPAHAAAKPAVVDSVPDATPAPKAVPSAPIRPAAKAPQVAPASRLPQAPATKAGAAPAQTQQAPAAQAVKQVPAGTPLPATTAITPVPQLPVGNPLLPAKDGPPEDSSGQPRNANPSTSATRAKAHVRPSDVGLTSEQTNAILEIRKSTQSALEKRLTEELKVAKLDLNASMVDATPADEVRKKFDLVQKKYLELQKIKFERTLKIREVLSVDQRKKLQDKKNSH